MKFSSLSAILRKFSFTMLLLALPGAACGFATVMQPDFKASIADLKQVTADSWRISGGNIIVKGNVHVPFGSLDIYADEAVLNIENRDLEATGNITVFSRSSRTAQVTPAELSELQMQSGLRITVDGIKTTLQGKQTISISAASAGDNIRARKISGNLISGYLCVEDASIRFKNFVARAALVMRKPGGELTLKDAEISTCEYLEHQNSHYSIKCGKAVLTPHRIDETGLKNFDPDRGEYTVWAYNCTWRFYGVPVLWIPVLYKPKDESPGLFKSQYGDSSDYGFIARFSKKFDMTDYPYSNAKLLLDFYSLRGWGYGADVNVHTENSKTTLYAYSIYDKRPYNSTDVRGRRINIPHQRYDVSINNVTHITPTLDFRGSFNLSSDYYMRRDYSNFSFSNDPEPPSFIALEKQFERFSAALLLRGRTNEFYTTVEKLPEFRIDIPRQQIFKTNLYYQGENSIAYMQMKWREWDESLPAYRRKAGYDDPFNYESLRVDSLHFIYYPLSCDFITFVPRAGVRFTDYTRSSKRAVDSDMLGNLFAADSMNAYGPGVKRENNYDANGGNRFRVVAEFGFETSSKIYSSWQNIRNSFLQLDGLRHVIEPYTNYTFIPKPTVNRNYIYAFDDIDRIDEQNFIRLGLFNRIQTRSGNSIREYFSMENYWDFFLQKQDGYNHIGDFCTKLTLRPFKGLSTTAFFSIDAGGNSTELADVNTYRHGRDAGKPGLNLSRLNRFYWSVSYEPVESYKFTFRYDYQGNYRSPSTYSMGSTLSYIEGGSAFDKYYLGRSQTLTFGVSMPLTPDRKTYGTYSISYDFELGYVTSQRVSIVRRLHCWDVAFEFQRTCGYDDGDKEYENSFMVTAYLTGLTGPLQQAQGSFTSHARQAWASSGGSSF